ncbi:MAG: hypothetical protein AVDCRST_MAG48-3323, partial [uncultured Friedmanniella sp.]
ETARARDGPDAHAVLRAAGLEQVDPGPEPGGRGARGAAERRRVAGRPRCRSRRDRLPRPPAGRALPPCADPAAPGRGRHPRGRLVDGRRADV